MSPVDDIEADLDDHMSGRDLPETFRVTDDATAGWALGKLRAAKEEKDRIARVAADRRAAVTEWETFAVKPLDDTIGFFTSLLAAYRTRLQAENPKAAATYQLPEGDLKWSKGGTLSTKVADAKAFAAFAEEYGVGDLVRNEPKVKAEDVKKSTAFAHHGPDADGIVVLVTPAGDIVPGVHLVEKAPSVTVTTHRPVAEVTAPEPSEPLPTEPEGEDL